MLKRLLSFHKIAAQSSLSALFTKPISSILTIVVIAISLIIPTLFWVLHENLTDLTKNTNKSAAMLLYLSPSSTEKDAEGLLNVVSSMPDITEAKLITPKEGLAELEAVEGMANISKFLPKNPLPAVIEAIPSYNVNTPLEVNVLFDKLKGLSLVDDVKLNAEWVNKLHAFLDLLYSIMNGLMIILAGGVLLIISTTLRLNMQSRHEEVEVLKLIGADDSYILRPFLYTGIWYGFLGACLALIFIFCFIEFLRSMIFSLLSTYGISYHIHTLGFKHSFFLLLMAIILGFLGARMSINRQLSSIEPCR